MSNHLPWYYLFSSSIWVNHFRILRINGNELLNRLGWHAPQNREAWMLRSSDRIHPGKWRWRGLAGARDCGYQDPCWKWYISKAALFGAWRDELDYGATPVQGRNCKGGGSPHNVYFQKRLVNVLYLIYVNVICIKRPFTTLPEQESVSRQLW